MSNVCDLISVFNRILTVLGWTDCRFNITVSLEESPQVNSSNYNGVKKVSLSTPLSLSLSFSLSLSLSC